MKRFGLFVTCLLFTVLLWAQKGHIEIINKTSEFPLVQKIPLGKKYSVYEKPEDYYAVKPSFSNITLNDIRGDTLIFNDTLFIPYNGIYLLEYENNLGTIFATLSVTYGSMVFITGYALLQTDNQIGTFFYILSGLFLVPIHLTAIHLTSSQENNLGYQTIKLKNTTILNVKKGSSDTFLRKKQDSSKPNLFQKRPLR